MIVYYVQTGVLASQSTKKHNITVQFRAPLDPTDDETAASEICYDEFRKVDEFMLLKTQQFKRYAYM